MAIIIASIALLLCWLWIEITLSLINANAREVDNIKKVSYAKFIWVLRSIIVLLFVIAIIYMYFFENIKFQKAIEYCLGIIR